MKKIIVSLMVLMVTASFTFAGGWNVKKGLDKITLNGELVCLGCSLKKLDGANAQCNLYAHHAIGFKMADGTLWSIVDNAKGHDVIRAHKLLGRKKATVTGWIFPSAHHIEIDTIKVDGVTEEQIQKAGWEEDQLLSKRLASRKMGQAPESEHKH
ncbi:MAG: hypothetical protein GY795_49060 [Desulfobacterales bacterium]|nr:hypothetical protein [Desulfobacterales bacterium]